MKKSLVSRMKSNNTIYLDSKEIKEIIAKALNIPIANVISTHYSFGLQGISEEEAKNKLAQLGIKTE